ncbi:hypothetical protein CPB86DRAFT_367169 [Serendipita vermifera]|nr:hypothetical protein CPB86DRAFT_367169 [Serendipita vermifera]
MILMLFQIQASGRMQHPRTQLTRSGSTCASIKGTSFLEVTLACLEVFKPTFIYHNKLRNLFKGSMDPFVDSTGQDRAYKHVWGGTPKGYHSNRKNKCSHKT